MKKLSTNLIKGVFLMLLLLLAANRVMAATDADLTYTVTDGQVTITDCDTAASGELVIPGTIEGYPVTGIGERAFYGCDSLVCVVIPESVTVIEDDAFYSCTALTQVTVPDSVTRIGEEAFFECTSLTSFTIPKGVTAIEDNTFSRCYSLATVDIHDNVTAIGAYAFDYCHALTSVTIPQGVPSIGTFTFNQCESLTEIILPDSVTSIGNYAFCDCTELTTAELGSSLTTLGHRAFERCYKLESITIPATTVSIGAAAFQNCTSMTSVTIHGSGTYIDGIAFALCTSLETICFTGSAPELTSNVFADVVAMVCYPAGDRSWTPEIMQGQGGSFTWQTHSYQFTSNGDATCTGEGTKTGICDHCGVHITEAEPALGHRYDENEVCLVCGKTMVWPTLELAYPSLTFEDMITINAHFSGQDMEDVVEMGMITYTGQVSQWNVDNAQWVTPGAAYNDTLALYAASSQGIAAKDMGDTFWLAVYAKLGNGSYVYTDLVSYSPIDYAYNQLEDEDPRMKQLVIAMLNYGAAAQAYFGYDTDNLMNAHLTQEQLASIESYRPDMISPVAPVDEFKGCEYYNTETFYQYYPAVTFDGAFSINYYCDPVYTPLGDVVMHYWTQEDFDAVEFLNPSNVTGIITMKQEGDYYTADISGIAAKDIDKGVYVAFLYEDTYDPHSTNVLGYSIGTYCASQIAANSDIAPFAEATAVYGYYAKQIFGN